MLLGHIGLEWIDCFICDEMLSSIKVTRNCSNCNTPLERVGDMKFRVGGYSGIGGMFLGGWNQLAESTQTFTLYKCNQCGKVEFYEPRSDGYLTQDIASGEKKHHFL